MKMKKQRSYQECYDIEGRHEEYCKLGHDSHCLHCGWGQYDYDNDEVPWEQRKDDLTWCESCVGDVCGECDCGHWDREEDVGLENRVSGKLTIPTEEHELDDPFPGAYLTKDLSMEIEQEIARIRGFMNASRN